MASDTKKIDETQRQKWLAQVEACSPSDFDGHTEFRNFTMEQRLDWLAQAVQIAAEFKGKARGRNSERLS
jgi:hypothetical protein